MPSTAALILCLLYVSHFYNGLVQAQLQVYSAALCNDLNGKNGINANPSRCGDDSFMVKKVEKGNFFYSGVFDGAGTKEPCEISRELAKRCQQVAETATDWNSTTVLLKAQQEIKKSKLSLTGFTTALTLGIDLKRAKLHATNYGSSGFVVIREGRVVKQSKELVNYWKPPYDFGCYSDIITVNEMDMVYTFDLIPEDIIVLATDGLWDNIFTEQIISISKPLATVKKNDFPESFAKELVEQSQLLAKKKSHKSPYIMKMLANRKFKNTLFRDEGKLDDTTVVVLYISEPSKQKTASRNEIKNFGEIQEARKSQTYCYEDKTDPSVQKCFRIQQKISCFKVRGVNAIDCEASHSLVLNSLYERFLKSFEKTHHGEKVNLQKSDLDVLEKDIGKSFFFIDHQYKGDGTKYIIIQQVLECFALKGNLLKKLKFKVLDLLDKEYEKFLDFNLSELLKDNLEKCSLE